MEPLTVVSDRPSQSPTARAGAGHTTGPARVWAGLVLLAVARAYRAFLVTLVTVALVPMLWNWTSHVVQSGSMTPALSIGDVVVGKPLSPSTRIATGRVMVFADPANERTLIHRVVERMADGTFTTAGDANESVDSTPVPKKNFIARGVICIPFVGLPVVWLRNHDVTVLMVWGIITVLALFLAAQRPGADDSRRRRESGRNDNQRLPTKSVLLQRSSVGVACVGLLSAGFVMMPVGQADAAFSARTVSSGSTWKVAMTTSNVTSNIRVYDTATSSGWYQRAWVSVNIYAAATPGSAVRSVIYRINSGTPVTTNSSSVVFDLANQGDNTITYYATDNGGGVEAARTTHIKLDNQPPVFAVTSAVGDVTHAQWKATCAQPGSSGGVCGTVQDGPGSGVASVQYTLSRSSDQRCFDGDKWTGGACTKRQSGTFGSGTWFVAIPDARLEVARTSYTITMFATDIAGNAYSTTRSFSVG